MEPYHSGTSLLYNQYIFAGEARDACHNDNDSRKLRPASIDSNERFLSKEMLQSVSYTDEY